MTQLIVSLRYLQSKEVMDMDLEKFDQAHTYAEKQSTNQFEDGLHLIELLAPGKGEVI